jgi:GntR family transcriptional repressor for pyruvate dehydrogenase complex
MNYANPSAVRIPKASAMVAADIRKQVLMGQLRPGDYLPLETQMASDFGVGRATIREAIRILEAEGLAHISRGARRGPRILQPSADVLAQTMGVALQTRQATIRDVYEVRCMIEPSAARLAAQHNAREASMRLASEVLIEEGVIEGRDERQMYRLFGQFHRTLMDCSGNITLSLLGIALEGPVSGHLSLLYANSRRKEDWWAQMELSIRSRRKLAHIIGEGDGDAAAAHWARHMEKTGVHWLSGVSVDARVNIVD